MKKVFMLLLAVLGILIGFILEGGELRMFINPPFMFSIFMGTLFTTLFSFSFTEIVTTFKEAFSNTAEHSKEKDYTKCLLIVENLENATIFWAVVAIITAFINILCHKVGPDELGYFIGGSFIALLYGFGLKAGLYLPMKVSLKKKIHIANN